MKIKKSKIITLSLIAVLLISAIWFIVGFINFVNTPLLNDNTKPVEFVYIQGSSVRGLVKRLYQNNILKNPIYFLVLAKLDGSIKLLKAGEYQITPEMRPSLLLERMVNGEAIMHTLTIPPGFTFSQVIKTLNDNTFVTHTLKNLSNEDIMRALNHAGEAPEGRFAADTYLFHSGTKDTVILKLAYQYLAERLNKAWLNRSPTAYFSCPYEALIAASIIEKETGIHDERSKIAGVIMRRLRKNMPLEMDPTVIYGKTHDFSSPYKLTKADLAENTSYNTYLHRGLPITPIAMPGEDSIIAALHPDNGNELYYVAKADGSGRHNFSASFQKHLEHVKEYRAKDKK